MIKEATSLAREAAHSTPPAVYVAAGFLGYTWSELSAAAIFIFTVMQIIRALPKTVRCISCFIRNMSCNGSCKEMK